jgi:hypothetical protein
VTRHPSPYAAATVALVVSLLSLCGATSASASSPGTNGYIVFAGDTNSITASDEIWAVRPDGSDLHQILPNTAIQTTHLIEVSPDGTQALLLRPVAPGLAVQTLDLQTGALTVIDQPWGGPPFASDSDPAYSPDGTKIAFQRSDDGLYYVMNADGTGTATLVGPTQPYPETGEGVLSPDGTQLLSIAPAPDVPGNGAQLYITNVATGTTTRLTSFQPQPGTSWSSHPPVINAVWQTLSTAAPAPPTITHQVSPATPDGTNGWYVNAPTVTFTCAGSSPIVSCVVDGTTSSSKTFGESANGQGVSGTATDSLGNVAHDTVPGAFYVDLTPPTLTCNQSNPTFTVGDQATVSATVTDSTSGTAAPTVSAPAQTTAVGSFAVSLTGQDWAGNTATISCPYTVKAAPPPPPTPGYVGDGALESHTDSNAAGLSEAFHFTATMSGTVDHLSVYLDKTSKAGSVVVGIYSGNATHPATLLAQAVISTPANGEWNSVATAPTNVVKTQDYWIAILGPKGTGVAAFRDRCCGGNGNGNGATETSKSTSLSTLPATWTTGSRYTDGPFSAFGTSGG